MTLYLQGVLGLSPLHAGLVYLPCTAMLFIASALTAQLLRRAAPGALVASGLALVSLGMVLSLLADARSSWVATLPGLLIAGIGTGLFNPALSAVALGSAPPQHSGLAAGVNDTFRHAGIAVGVAAFGALIPTGAALGHDQGASYVTGYHHALIAGAVIAAAGSALSALLIGVVHRDRAVDPAVDHAVDHALDPAADLTASLLEPA